MRYTVDETTFAINIYNDGDDIPFHFQPDYPNGDPFDSIEEARAWAEASIASHSAEVLVGPPIGKNIPGEAKPDPNVKAALLARLGITAE